MQKVVFGHLYGEHCFVKKIYKNARGEFIHVDRGADPWSDFLGQLVYSPIHFFSMAGMGWLGFGLYLCPTASDGLKLLGLRSCNNDDNKFTSIASEISSRY